MRQIMIIAIVLIGFFACTTQRGIVKVEASSEHVAAEDSVEYGLETFDAKFETWYVMQKSPARYRSQSYYENWNRQYVTAWNHKAMTSGNSFFEMIVGYNPTIDYGFDLNHELFYYFMYVENVLKIQIMPGGPRSIVFI